MNAYKRMISGAVSGLAGALAKSLVNNIQARKTIEPKHRVIKLAGKKIIVCPLEEKKPRNRLLSLIGLGLGVAGGIGTHFVAKNKRDFVTDMTSGFVIGTMSDLGLNAATKRIKKQNKKPSILLGNGIYGFVTALVNKGLGRHPSKANHLHNYIEYMQVREKLKDRKTKLRRFTNKDDLPKTS